MRVVKQVSIDIDNSYCGKDCPFKHSIAQFNMTCFLYKRNLEYVKTIIDNKTIYFQYKRLKECLDSENN